MESAVPHRRCHRPPDFGMALQKEPNPDWSSTSQTEHRRLRKTGSDLPPRCSTCRRQREYWSSPPRQRPCPTLRRESPASRRDPTSGRSCHIESEPASWGRRGRPEIRDPSGSPERQSIALPEPKSESCPACHTKAC